MNDCEEILPVRTESRRGRDRGATGKTQGYAASKLQNAETWDHLEMANILGQDGIALLDSSGGDEHITKDL